MVNLLKQLNLWLSKYWNILCCGEANKNNQLKARTNPKTCQVWPFHKNQFYLKNPQAIRTQNPPGWALKNRGFCNPGDRWLVLRQVRRPFDAVVGRFMQSANQKGCILRIRKLCITFSISVFLSHEIPSPVIWSVIFRSALCVHLHG